MHLYVAVYANPVKVIRFPLPLRAEREPEAEEKKLLSKEVKRPV